MSYQMVHGGDGDESDSGGGLVGGLATGDGGGGEFVGGVNTGSGGGFIHLNKMEKVYIIGYKDCKCLR
ncbi:hypothetical protein Patl1_07430 [Pistacia atlantica]|uniref:Uncharacterized protein n=1 Tax=Pistacia atlantica TaxID=434234 RepID=A0ACC1AKY8_9ROSI|nr:hypothetical protein Patl1_07430 [Pistacia atlantica]